MRSHLGPPRGLSALLEAHDHDGESY